MVNYEHFRTEVPLVEFIQNSILRLVQFESTRIRMFYKREIMLKWLKFGIENEDNNVGKE